MGRHGIHAGRTYLCPPCVNTKVKHIKDTKFYSEIFRQLISFSFGTDFRILNFYRIKYYKNHIVTLCAPKRLIKMLDNVFFS